MSPGPGRKPLDDQAPLPPGDEDYYAAIERHFIALRGSPLFITPREWQLIHEWHQKQIPLRVVRGGLDRAFERPAPSRGVRRLMYCRQTVEAAFRSFCEAMTGASGTGTEITDEEGNRIENQLREQEQRLREASERSRLTRPALAEVLGAAAAEIASMVSRLPAGFAEVEGALTRMEDGILRAAEAVLGESECESCKREAEIALAEYRPRMPEEVYRDAIHSAYLKRVRARFGLPALSLFYL